ncbi:hypothetical protein C4579_01410 [Candidatus Microgenomates bacterium]|nr:MAG: hypothetical protein C4579_01410 [Candidatus Microgenomates bacterium]
MKKIIFVLVLFFCFLVWSPKIAVAGDCTQPATNGTGCSTDLQCAGDHGNDPTWQCYQTAIGSPGCHCQPGGIITPPPPPGGPGTGDPVDPGTGDPVDPGTGDPVDPGTGDPFDPNNPFGVVDNPFGNTRSALGEEGALVTFFRSLLILIFVAAGMYAFIRIVLAGLKFISAGGDSKKIGEAWEMIWSSLLGLVIIISSLAIAALIGQVVYGDPLAILSPRIFGPN